MEKLWGIHSYEVSLMLFAILIASCSTLKNEKVNYDVTFITNHDGEELEHTLTLEQSFTVPKIS